jgi:hypothetical protein
MNNTLTYEIMKLLKIVENLFNLGLGKAFIRLIQKHSQKNKISH